MRGLIQLVTPWAKDRRRGQLTAWLSGLFIFFDDYANTIVLGNTLRALSDRLRISREKLAYLVDSTAAPVAGIAPLSTWVAIEILQIAEGLRNAGAQRRRRSVGGVRALSLQHPVPLLCHLDAHLRAARRRPASRIRPDAQRAEKAMVRTGTSPGRIDTSAAEDDHAPPRWYNAALPIGLTIGLIIWLLVQTGYTGCIAKYGEEGFAALDAREQLQEDPR